MVSILNCDIQNISKEQLLSSFTTGVLITPNVDHLVRLQWDNEFYEIYQKAEWVICDSKILAFASRILRTPICEVIQGSGFFPDFCEFHKNNEEIKIFILGGAAGVPERAMTRINSRFSRNLVVGAYSPSYGFENDPQECSLLRDKIKTSGATVVVACLGAPKQEKWIYKTKDLLPRVKIFMALGATVDFEAGTLKRAPVWMQNVGLEWFYRLASEPRRLWRRYLLTDAKFFLYLAMQLLGLYKDPFHKRGKIQAKFPRLVRP